MGGYTLMLIDNSDPTTALFISEGAASRAASMVERQFPHRIKEAQPKLKKSRGEILGYYLQLHFKDNRNPTPLTNSDFERLQ
jgi:hypothetical protein